MAFSEQLDRSVVELAVFNNALAWREFHQRVLRRAGYGQVNVLPAEPDCFVEYFSNGAAKRTDLVLFEIESATEEPGWSHLQQLRALYKGPLLITSSRFCPAIQRRIEDLGLHDYLPVGECEEEGVGLKVDTVLTSNRINTLIEDNDHRAQRLFVNILTVMVKILESKDHYTRFHSHSVALWSRMIGRKKGLSEEELIRLGLAAVFHDFGKIGIPEEVLNKPDKLTEEEFAVMQQHPTIARDLLSSLDLFSDLLPAITHHHERWDGKGYPAGLRGTQTPLWARIICIADSYDTMASRRTYKAPLSPSRVREELQKGSATQFDPELVEIMLQILAENAPDG